MLKVDTACMENQARQMEQIAKQLNIIASRVADVDRQLRWNTSIDAIVRSRLIGFSSAVSVLDNKAAALTRTLDGAIAQYTQAENNAKHNQGGSSSSSSQSTPEITDPDKWWDKIIGKLLPGIIIGGATILPTVLPLIYNGGIIGNVFIDILSGDGTFTPHNDWFGHAADEDHTGVTAWIGKTGGTYESDNISGEVNGYIGKGRADIDADFSLFETKTKKEYKDGKWDEDEKTTIINAELGGEISASGIAGDTKIETGDDMFGTEVELEGSALKAKAEGKGHFSVGEEGINAYLKGEAIVSAVDGKVSGTLNILGLEFVVSAGGYAGALGVEAETGIKNGNFVAEVGAAAGIGGSIGIEIGVNEEGWNNFVDFVTFWD